MLFAPARRERTFVKILTIFPLAATDLKIAAQVLPPSLLLPVLLHGMRGEGMVGFCELLL